MHDAAPSAMVDVAFAVRGTTLPRDHRALLAAALVRTLPWLADEEAAGVHRLKLVQGGGGESLVGGRTRLVLRLPRARSPDAARACGTQLDIGGHSLAIGEAAVRELLPHGTLYAHFVAADAIDALDEAAFLRGAQAELDRMEVRGRVICGRWQTLEAPALSGCSLMVDGLAPEASLRVLERGIGRHRRLGCGLFVPHKSAAAVGAPA